MIPLRDSQPSYSKPFVTIALIAVNVLVFLYEISLDPFSLNHLMASYGLVPSQFQLTALATSMFLHGGWLHLLGNMWFLWIFGDNVEDRFGHLKFLIFYLLAGIAATFAQFALAPHSTVPNVGASGAIAGVLGAYILMFPQARVNVLLGRQIVAMPALIVLGMWIALQLVSGVGTIAYTDESANVGGVAYMAHIGGFAAGLLMAFLFRGPRLPDTTA